MNDKSLDVAPGYPDLAMLVLVPEDDLPSTASVQSEQTPATVVTDPQQIAVIGVNATFDLRLSSLGTTTRLELPYDRPDDLYELLETLYIMDGWRAVDDVVDEADRALVWTLLDLFPIAGIGRVRNVPPYYRFPPIDPYPALHTLISAVARSGRMPKVLEAVRLVQPTANLFSEVLDQMLVPERWGKDPDLRARVLANLVVPLRLSRAALAHRVRWSLWRVERESMRLLTSVLEDARATILREAVRYFDLTPGRAEDSLKWWTTWRIRSSPVGTGGATRLADEPAALWQAVRDLQPSASLVAAVTERFQRDRVGPEPVGPEEQQRAHERRRASAYGEVEHSEPMNERELAELASVRAAFAREVGRRAQAFPVLTQFDADQVLEAATATEIQFREIVFTMLGRAHWANIHMRSRAAKFVGIADTAPAATHPERVLADAVEVCLGLGELAEICELSPPGTTRALEDRLGDRYEWEHDSEDREDRFGADVEGQVDGRWSAVD